MGAAVPSRCLFLLLHLQTHISSLQLQFQSRGHYPPKIFSTSAPLLKHGLVMQILKCATCESICWENKTPLHSPGSIYCSPFTIHLPANIPMITRERMITSKVFAISEVPMRIAAEMEKRLFISKVPFLQSNRKGDRVSRVFLSCRWIPSVSCCPKPK